MKKVLTLCLVLNENKILLGLKKRGFGEGRWNGFGGKVEEGESIEDGAKRELFEESGIIAEKMEEVGVITFSFQEIPKIQEVHIFKILEYKGEIKETEEMKPEWFDINEIPYSKMWTDDEYWLPLVLLGKKVKGEFFFDKPSDSTYASKVISHNLDII